MSAAHTAGQLGEVIEIDSMEMAIDWPVIDERHECGSDHYPITLTSGDPDELKANADRVRLCWNAHDDLVKALQAARKKLDELHYQNSGRAAADIYAVMGILDAALAKAGSQ